MARLIGVTGGIGSGKSTICRCVAAMGYLVYDCDLRAKALMDSSAQIKERIAAEISAEAIGGNGEINRKALSAAVFNDAEKLALLNAIVHGSVREDIRQWAIENQSEEILFIESAIMHQSGLDKMMDEIWEADAPQELRIERVCRRSGLTPEEVLARIRSQHIDDKEKRPCVKTIINDGRISVLAQINELLAEAIR